MASPDTTTSADGTPIALEVLGDGPPVVLVPGIFCTRATLRPLAEALAEGPAEGLADRCRVAVYDRRGRGHSGGSDQDGHPPAHAEADDVLVAREVADLVAVIAALGGSAAVYGHSSGAALALRAAAADAPITRLVLHEPPFGGDEADEVAGSHALAGDVRAALADDRPGDAIARFMADMGLPEEVLAGIVADPAMRAVAPTMPYDLAATGAGGTVPADLARSLAVPTLVLAGTASPPFFRTTAERLAELVSGATLALLDGADHGAPADVVAPAVARFLAGAAG